MTRSQIFDFYKQRGLKEWQGLEGQQKAIICFNNFVISNSKISKELLLDKFK